MVLHEKAIIEVTLHYAGPPTWFEACKSNTYVADRLEEKTFGEYLVA